MLSVETPDRLTGVIPVIVTPYDDAGNIDAPALHNELDALNRAGVTWVAIGYGSEVDRLDPIEQQALVALVTSRSAGPALMGNIALDDPDPATMRDRLAGLHRSGVRVVLARPGEVGSDAIGAISERLVDSPIGVVLQDAPQTGVVLDVPALARLLREVPALLGVKIEPDHGADDKIRSLREALDGHPALILGGNGGRDFLQERQSGSGGTMPGPAFPEVFQRIDAERAAGRVAEGRSLQEALVPLAVAAAADGIDSFIHAQKRVLVRRGVLVNSATRGYTPSASVRAAIETAIDGLLADGRLGLSAGAVR